MPDPLAAAEPSLTHIPEVREVRSISAEFWRQCLIVCPAEDSFARIFHRCRPSAVAIARCCSNKLRLRACLRNAGPVGELRIAAPVSLPAGPHQIVLRPEVEPELWFDAEPVTERLPETIRLARPGHVTPSSKCTLIGRCRKLANGAEPLCQQTEILYTSIRLSPCHGPADPGGPQDLHRRRARDRLSDERLWQAIDVEEPEEERTIHRPTQTETGEFVMFGLRSIPLLDTGKGCRKLRERTSARPRAHPTPSLLFRAQCLGKYRLSTLQT